VETTLDEVVDVTLLGVTPQGQDALSVCLVEAAWALDLPKAFDDTHAKYEVQL
jgi:hypothetical protein